MTNRLLLALAFLAAAFAARAEEPTPCRVGDALPAFELPDAKGVVGRVDESVRLLVFTADMDAGRLLRTALEDPALQDLAAHRAVYVADVSRMPAVVTRLFALPSIRRRPYRTLLDTDGAATARIPREPGKVTLLALDALVVREIAFATAPDAVAAAVRAAGSPDGS